MQKYIEVFKTSPLFAGMTDDEILSILSCVGGRLMTAEKGEYILSTGDTTHDMGMVLTGSVLLIQEDIWGRRNILSKCGRCEFFGEPFAANPELKLNISMVAEEKTVVLMLNIHRILGSCTAICSHHSRLISNLVKVFASKIMIFNDKITHMSKRTTREKLLSYLSTESIRKGNSSFDISYDRQQLADFLCVDRAAMSVELSKLQKEGLIKTNRNHFEILKDGNLE